jgi:putative two-component system response regulator
LIGTDIPLAGRLVAIADTFDALTSKRPYKDPYPKEVVYDILKKERGEHFSPEILDVFIENFDQFFEIRGKVGLFEGDAYGNFILSERDRTDN